MGGAEVADEIRDFFENEEEGGPLDLDGWQLELLDADRRRADRIRIKDTLGVAGRYRPFLAGALHPVTRVRIDPIRPDPLNGGTPRKELLSVRQTDGPLGAQSPATPPGSPRVRRTAGCPLPVDTPLSAALGLLAVFVLTAGTGYDALVAHARERPADARSLARPVPELAEDATVAAAIDLLAAAGRPLPWSVTRRVGSPAW